MCKNRSPKQENKEGMKKENEKSGEVVYSEAIKVKVK